MDHAREIATLTAQVGDLVKELRVQLMRIGQIQAQLDRLADGQATVSTNRRRLEDIKR